MNHNKCLFIFTLVLVSSLIYINSISTNTEQLTNITSSPKLKLVLYYTSWCGHSMSFINGDWKEFKSYADQNLKDKVDVQMIECDKQKELCKNIQGYPTLILYKNGQAIPFNQDRSVDNLIKFISDNM